eukprot:TRINITY_DN13805_c0_g1_i2.p2 TRINITY_DN13805_c0_g1~~TRINITY_DN13805_c0_g1_i2.p2  ORF type:complete len:116 (+),score=31.87 TRINITY_DN13805_c0_g1_i2:457-804(+)
MQRTQEINELKHAHATIAALQDTIHGLEAKIESYRSMAYSAPSSFSASSSYSSASIDPAASYLDSHAKGDKEERERREKEEREKERKKRIANYSLVNPNLKKVRPQGAKIGRAPT